MRFESIHIARYGCLAGLQTPDPLPSIVVVLGPNESGKSTFFSFLTNLLYGFRPATAEGHPYTPWSGGNPEGFARIRLDDGTVLELERRLASAGRGRVTTDGATQDIRNRSLAATDHVNRGIFRHVYALTLAELASLEGESWNIVQDRLVAALGMRGLKPAREVAAQFEGEANRLWRPDNRGRPRFRILQDELTALNERRRGAVERDRRLRERVAEKARAERELDALRAERRAARVHREVLEHRIGRLRPLRRAILRIEDLLHTAGVVEEIEALPADPRGHLESLRARRREAGVRVEELGREVAVCREAIEAYEEGGEAAIVRDGERLRRAARLATEMAALKRHAAVAEDDVAHMTARCDEHGASLFSAPRHEVSLEALQAVPAAPLLKTVRDYQAARAKLAVEEDGERDRNLMRLPAAMRPGSAGLVAGVILLAAGLGLGAWPALYPDTILSLGSAVIPATAALSAALLFGVIGIILLIMRLDAGRRYRQYRRAVAAAEKQRAMRIATLGRRVGEARSAVTELVADLPIAPRLLEAPSLDLPSGIERMAELADRLAERKRVLGERRDRVRITAAEIRETREWVAARVGADAEAELGGLSGILENALKAREGAVLAREHLDRLEGELVEAVEKSEAATRERDGFVSRLAALGDGDADSGAASAAARLDALRRAGDLGDELERENPDLDEAAGEIAAAEGEGEEWGDLPERLDAAVAHRDELAERSEALQATIGRLESEIAHLGKGETVDAVDGRIELVRGRMQEAREGRDRAFLLARLTREADRRFREENQPELLLRAGRYLRQVTRGRYDRIEMGDAGDESFYLREPAGSRRVRVGETTSQGTKEQVYLALRLAIVNHLDSGHERLPIFMDETLVNWDAWRRDRAFDLLRDLASERQVFIFTCHPAMAAEMEDRGGTIIALAPD